MEKESFDAAQDRPQIQINLDPNLYAISNASIMFGEEEFHFLVTSGNHGRQFTASPKHAKRIYLLLKQQIENYEKQFGELKTELPQRPPASPSLGGQTTQEEPKLGF